MRTYYEVLGVEEDADTEAIRAAYRDRVKETHPDLSDDPDAQERFKRVTEAKEVLTDPTERQRYDRLGHARYVGGATGGSSRPGEERENDAETRAHTATGSAYKRRQRERRKWSEYWREQHERNDDPSGRGQDGTDAGQRDGHGKRRWSGQRAGSQQRYRRDAGATGGTSDPWWTRSERFTGATSDDGDARRTWGSRETGATGSGTGTRTESTGKETAGSETAGRRETGYRVTRTAPPGPKFTAGRVGLSVVTFLLYPVFLASTFLPGAPFVVNVLVGMGTLLLVTYLVARPEAGVLVFGGWTVLAPVSLLVSGVGLFNPVGFLLWTACWVPCLLAAMNLVFHSS